MAEKKKIRKRPVRSLWMVTREYGGLAGAGGVKDVCRQLAETLAREKQRQVRVILPRYGFMDTRRLGFNPLQLYDKPLTSCHPRPDDHFAVDMNYTAEDRRETVSIWVRKQAGVTILLVEAERFAEKLGVYTYTAREEASASWKRQGAGHFDYFAMNILLQKATLDLIMLLQERPDIIHCQDGHAATLPAILCENPGYRHYFRATGTVVTIHNAGLGYHQEVDDLAFARRITGLPERVILAGCLGKYFDPFVAAAGYAAMNTVSENYARELQETGEDQRTGWLGHRLLQQGVHLEGITNGINPADFDPSRPKKLGLPAGFAPLRNAFDGKAICKQKILSSMRQLRRRKRVQQIGRLMGRPDAPLFTFIGRLTGQKGVDVLLEGVELLTEKTPYFQLLILGSGEPAFEERIASLTDDLKLLDRCCFLKGYDEDLATKIYAAGDFFLIPSLYEPCGLTDFMAQLMGNLPIVHHVGGLVKVVDGETGFAYKPHTGKALAATMLRAIDLYEHQPHKIRAMQRAAVKRIHTHHTWKQVVDRYLVLYDQAMQMCCQR